MKNAILWLLPTGACLLMLAVGVNVERSTPASSATSDQLNACDLKTGQTGTIRGRVVAFDKMPGSSQSIATIATPSGCEVEVSGHPRELGELGVVNNTVRFRASVQGVGLLSNPQGIEQDTTAGSAPAVSTNASPVVSEVETVIAPPAVMPPPLTSLRAWIHDSPQWISPSEGVMVIGGRHYLISTDLAKQIKYNQYNSFYFSGDGRSITAVQPN